MEKQRAEELKARILRGATLSQKELLELIDDILATAQPG